MADKKSSKKKGDILEYLVAILEKSSVDNPTTKIYPKHLLRDRDGIGRELDLYVEVQVNRKLIKYAFECKNYKNGVSLSHITDFYSKIEGLGIKGFFVTTSNYQSGAVKKAKALNIELFTLRKRQINTEDLKGLLLFRKQYEVIDVSVLGSKPIRELNIKDIFTTCESCKKSLYSLMSNEAIPYLLKNLDSGVEAIKPEFKDMEKIRTTFGKNNASEIGFVVTFNEASITHKGIKIPIDMIATKLKVWNEIYKDIPLNPQTFSYCSENEQEANIHFSLAEFVIEGENLLVTLIKHENGKTVGSIGKNNDILATEIYNLHSLGPIDQLGLKGSLESINEEPC